MALKMAMMPITTISSISVNRVACPFVSLLDLVGATLANPSAQARGKKRNGKAASGVFYTLQRKTRNLRGVTKKVGKGGLSARDGADKSVSNQQKRIDGRVPVRV